MRETSDAEIARLQERDSGHEKDISRLERSIDDVVGAVKGVSDELSGLRDDIGAMRQGRAKDVGFVAGVSAAITLIITLGGMGLEYLWIRSGK